MADAGLDVLRGEDKFKGNQVAMRTLMMGLGLKLRSIVSDLAGGSLMLTALYTALVLWLVGLAVPVTASYIICVVIAVPTLQYLRGRQLSARA